MPAERPAGSSSRKASTKPCPICGRPSVASAQPFCSDRCRDVDLNRWLSGSYAIPASQDEGDEED
jgi:endogenous inhibitor of DNA gyrase (YacG/DUF329 family)